MTRRDEDLAFAEFCRSGRPELLGRVFDLTAPALLLLACHLARGRDDAEDLVQATFVSAMEAAPRFDAQQPVFRWLAGILANHARMARRRAQRAIDPTRLPEVPMPAPIDVAAEQELVDAVAQALEQLPEHYRSVLVLRLRHGLEPIQIAHALGRSPETVRTQLARGLERLRAALPQAHALAALLLPGGRGLPAVRAIVLSHVPAPASAWFTLGGLFVTKPIWMAAAAAAVLLAAAAAWSLGLVDGTAPAPVLEPAVATPAATRAAAGDAQPESAATARTVAELPAAPAPATRAAPLLTGRCVAEASGQPLADCLVELTGGGAALRQTTAADGRFALALPRPVAAGTRLQVAHPDAVPLAAALPAPVPATGLDLGDVRLPRGVPVRGECVDPHGAAVMATLRVDVPGLPLGPLSGTASWRGSATPAVAFDLGVLPPGEYGLVALAPGLRLSAPRTLTVRSTDAPLTLRVVLEPAASLSGVVVDTHGTPRAGILVAARRPDRSEYVAASTNARGEFVVSQEAADSPPVALGFRSPTDGILAPVSVTPAQSPLPWGTGDIRVVLPEAPARGRLRVRVTAAATGAAVERFACRCEPVAETRAGASPPLLAGRPGLTGHHPGGEEVFASLAAGPHLVLVWPAGDGLAPAAPVACSVPAGGELVVPVALRSAVPFQVQVVRADRVPVAGAQVELLHPAGAAPVTLDAVAVPMDGVPDPLTRQPVGAPPARIHATAATGADGIATLSAPAGEAGMVVRVLPRHCAGAVVADVRIPTGAAAPLTVVVAAGASLAGRLTPGDLVARLGAAGGVAGLALVPVGAPPGQRLPAAPPWRNPVAADGAFHISGLPPGVVAIHLFWQTSARDASSLQVLHPALATVTLAADETRQLDLDGRAWTPAVLRGRLVAEGQPLARARWSLIAVEPQHRNLAIRGAVSDADGGFTAPAVPPGRYRVVVFPPQGQSLRQADALLQVAAGDTVERSFELGELTLVLQLTEADGRTPVADRLIAWQASGALPLGGAARTDAQGVLRVAPAPLLPAVFTTREPDTADAAFVQLPAAEQQRRTVRLGPVEPMAGQRELRVVFRLPAR